MSEPDNLCSMNTGQKIVVVEDEDDIVAIITYNLQREGYTTFASGRGDEALNMIRKERPDLVVLDLMLPGMDGLSVCQQLKTDPATRAIPIIIVSAKAEDFDVVIGLGMGADDYLAKPFSPRELVARIKVALRKAPMADTRDPLRLVYDELVIDSIRHETFVGGELVKFTAKEFKLLHQLASNPRRAFTREQLISGAFGQEVHIVDRNVDVHIASLRSKLGSAAEMIETVRGIGYRFSPE